MIFFPLLPIIAYILLWFIFVEFTASKNAQDFNWRKALIETSLVWSAYLVLGTEILSLIRGLTRFGIIFQWSFAIGILSFIHWRLRSLPKGWQRLKFYFSYLHLGGFDIVLLLLIVTALLILLITGLLSPPNIHDVLAYHMSRVMHWVQNRSLAYFSTMYAWELVMPPFSEISQLHWYLLAGSDMITSLPQWYSLVLAMITVSLISKRLGADRRGQWLAPLFLLSLPIMVLQASGSKNDIVLAFSFAALLFYVVEATFNQLNPLDWIMTGTSVALGVLTKGSFAFFTLPLLLWLLVVMLRKSGWKQTLAFAAVGLGMVIFLNGGHWVRNTAAFGNPLSMGGKSSLINAHFGVDVTVSNLSRNIAVQMNGKYGFINEAVQDVLDFIHARLRIPMFDPQTTHGPAEFYYVLTREEVAGNTFHFIFTILIFLITLAGLTRKKHQPAIFVSLGLVAVAFSGAIIFSTVFRWQAWSNRFFMPYYVFFAPVMGFTFGKLLPSFTSWAFGLVMILIMVNPLFNNYSRSFSWAEDNRNSIWRLSRRGLLFANNQNIEGAVLELTDQMESSGCHSYGILMRYNAPEYLLWAALKPSPQHYRLEHLAVGNETEQFSDPDFDPCGLVLFELHQSEVFIAPDFLLGNQWKIGDTVPFSLYLKPPFNIETGD